MYNKRVGYQICADDVAIETAGRPVTIYAINDKVATNTLNVYDGVDATVGTKIFTKVSPKAGALYVFPNGITFPNGAFIEGGTGGITVVYQAV